MKANEWFLTGLNRQNGRHESNHLIDNLCAYKRGKHEMLQHVSIRIKLKINKILLMEWKRFESKCVWKCYSMELLMARQRFVVIGLLSLYENKTFAKLYSVSPDE